MRITHQHFGIFPFCNVWFPLWKFNNNYSHLYYILYYIILSIYLSPGRTLEEKRDRKLNPKSFISGIAQEHQMVKRNRFLLRTLLLIVKNNITVLWQQRSKPKYSSILFYSFILSSWILTNSNLRKLNCVSFPPGSLVLLHVPIIH